MKLALEYRVTKYDPTRRDATGAYQAAEWTSFAEVGELISEDAYLRVEDAYVAAAVAFWTETGTPALFARGVENGGDAIAEGGPVSGDLLPELVRRVLREEMWCRVEGDGYFLHFGHDYYAYVGVSRECPEARALAAASGLFVEEMISPHHP